VNIHIIIYIVLNDNKFSSLMQLDSCDNPKTALLQLMLSTSVWYLVKHSSLWAILYALF